MGRYLKIWIGVATTAALVLAAVAFGHGSPGKTQQVSATFTATSVSNLHARTCTGDDGVYEVAEGKYTGTATSSDARLNGPVEIRVESVFNTTTKLGWLKGTLRVRGSSDAAKGDLVAVNTNGQLQGFVRGEGHSPGAKLLANVSSGFTSAAGFTNGQLGTGTGTNSALFFSTGPCRKFPKPAPAVVVFKLHLEPDEEVPPITGLHADARGSLTLHVTRDSQGKVVSGDAVFYVNYAFPGAVTITGLHVHKGAKGTNGSIVIDSGVTSIADADGVGNVTRVVMGVDPATLQAILDDPRGYYVNLHTSDNPGGALRDQLSSPEKKD